MNRIAFISLFVFSCRPGEQIKEGTYSVNITDQHGSCSDGTVQDNPDTTGTWTIEKSGNNWSLSLAPNLVIQGKENGNGLLFTDNGSMSYGVCSSPVTLAIDLSPDGNESFFGTVELSYDLVSCTNGNTGYCNFYSNVSGTRD